MASTYFPIIIIGGGPIGLACAIEAQKAGLKYLILERGCLVNSLYNYPVNMTFFSTSERLEIGRVPFVSINAKPTRPEALEYYRRVATSYQVNIHLFEEVVSVESRQLSVDSRQLAGGSRDAEVWEWQAGGQSQELGGGSHRPAGSLFNVTTKKAVYTADHIIIATGFYDIPYLLKVPGEDLAKVTHYYKDPHFYAFQKLIVVGAMNSAVDAALETWRKGAEVTMVIRGPQIGERVKYWVRPDIINRIKEGSIRAYFNSTVKMIREKEVDIETPEGPLTLANDQVIAMTGYQPNLAFLRSMGIQLSDDEVKSPLIDEQTHETNVKDIFLAGVICGGMNTHRLFIENSREHAEKIIATIVKKRQ
ncbi:MAG: YpdA family putative bacillithiol disulfide reductase [Chitinophagales bacterium]